MTPVVQQNWAARYDALLSAGFQLCCVDLAIALSKVFTGGNSKQGELHNQIAITLLAIPPSDSQSSFVVHSGCD